MFLTLFLANIQASAEAEEIDPALIINECNVQQAAWIFCDDFEEAGMGPYYDYFNRFGRFQERNATWGRGLADSKGLLSWYGYYDGDLEGPYGTWAKLAFGQTPDDTLYKPVGDPEEASRELYWRFYVKSNTGVDAETGEPLLASMGTGPLARIYGIGPDNTTFMKAEIAYPDQTGELVSTLYGGAFDENGEPTGISDEPLAQLRGDKPVMVPQLIDVGDWHRIEVHAKLNDPGTSNGVYELWIDGELESSQTGLNWVGDYADYGINVVEIYNNNQQEGVTGGDTENRIIDNMVLSRSPIGEAGVPAQNNANLSMIHNTIGKMTPGFQSTVTDYTVRLEAGTTEAVTLTPILSDPLAQLKVNGDLHANDTPIAMNGDPMVIEVLAQDGTTTQSYTIDVAYEQPFLTNECNYTEGAWLFCDDFEEDRFDQYFERTHEDQFSHSEGDGLGGSAGMKAEFRAADGAEHDTGALKLAFGRTPSDYLHPVAAEGEDLEEMYARFYIKHEEDWTGGSGDKVSRISSFQNADWAQSMAALVWGTENLNDPYLYAAPESGTTEEGELKKTHWNDFSFGRYMAGGHTSTPIYDEDHVGSWYAVEYHVKLNDPGVSNGIFELWIDDVLEVGVYNLNWIGAYEIGPDAGYGLNFFSLENYWNSGTPVDQERYFDNLVISREKIGLAVASGEEETGTPSAILTENRSSAQAGEGVDLTIGVADVAEAATVLDLTVNYDPNVLTFATETNGASVSLADSAIESLLPNFAVASAVKETTGQIRILMIGTGEEYAVNGDQTLVQLHGTVKEEAPLGNTAVTLSNVSTTMGGEEAQMLDVSGAALALTVTEFTEPADLTALQAAIAMAQNRYDHAVEGDKLGQYPTAAKSALQAAIEAAETIRGQSGVSQSAVNQAVIDLNTAVQTFAGEMVTLVEGATEISIRDLSIIAKYFGTTEGDADWSAIEKADIFGDGEITIQVLAAVAQMILDDWLLE